MQYVDCVNQGVAHSGASLLNKQALPFDVVADSLALKQQGTEFTEKFPGITSPEEQRLLNSRIGSTLARIATASYIAAQNGADVEYFGVLSETAQDDVKYKITKRYKKLYKRAHDWIDDVDPFAVVQDNDPLPALPNATMRSIVAQSKRAAITPTDRLRAFGSYLNVIPGSFPPESWPSTDFALNDVTLTRAFGRNDIPDKELPKIRDERNAAKDDESVMRYLESISFDPGDSNRALAKTVAQQLQSPAKVTEQIAQWEVVYALRQTFPEVYTRYSRYIHTVWPKSDFYPTYEVKADSIAVMDEIGAYNPIEFAHPDMMARAYAILGQQGVWADVLASDVPFDARSVQAQVRGPLPWTIRETATRAEHVLFNRVKF